jgi:hypothetical protein
MLSTIVGGYRKGRREFFEKHIEPLQHRMTEIHKDYIAGFQEARQHIRDDVAPEGSLIEFLKERRRDYECERQLSHSLADELDKAHRSGIRGETWEAVKRYCGSAVDYFSAGAEISGLSWYSDFLSMVEQWVIDGTEVWTGPARSIEGQPLKDLLSRLELLLDKRLPEAFATMTRNYAELRARLL